MDPKTPLTSALGNILKLSLIPHPWDLLPWDLKLSLGTHPWEIILGTILKLSLGTLRLIPTAFGLSVVTSYLDPRAYPLSLGTILKCLSPHNSPS